MATATEPAAKAATPKSRLIGPMPRIGIRPAIDGRMKGVPRLRQLRSPLRELAATLS